MLKAIQKLFSTQLHSEDSKTGQQQLDLAAAALLTEVMIADHDISEQELIQLKQLLLNEYSIAAEQVDELVQLAIQEVDESNDVYQFTKLINDHYEYADKCKLIQSLWHLAYADAVLDKYEEYTIRKICELIYVSHGDFIQAKMAVKNARNH
ncbi:MAG: TerB family tellurite resistance protein [Pseudomonadales bacterium]|nr:TerB family tellurite resistance protein [Pseudomonadales bacterium]